MNDTELHQYTVDSSISDLNVVEGTPLRNEFVVLVSCRNVESRIIRCLHSIKQEIHEHDVGIIFIDDSSTDRTSMLAGTYIREHFKDYIIVVNPIRKYFARNMYNGINFLCTNPDSIIVQVDGDDYLKIGSNVFNVLQKTYRSQNPLITFGSHDRIDVNGKVKFQHSKTNISDPWNYDQCTLWDHLKTLRKSAFDLITPSMLMERDKDVWIERAEDTIIQPTIVASNPSRAIFIETNLYVHDLTGSHAIFKYDFLYKAYKVKSNVTLEWKSLLFSMFPTYEEAYSYIENGGDLYQLHRQRERESIRNRINAHLIERNRITQLNIDRNKNPHNEKS